MGVVYSSGSAQTCTLRFCVHHLPLCLFICCRQVFKLSVLRLPWRGLPKRWFSLFLRHVCFSSQLNLILHPKYGASSVLRNVRINLLFYAVYKYRRPSKFMVAPCINNIKHFIVKLMQTNYKILRLLKQLKL